MQRIWQEACGPGGGGRWGCLPGEPDVQGQQLFHQQMPLSEHRDRLGVNLFRSVCSPDSLLVSPSYWSIQTSTYGAIVTLLHLLQRLLEAARWCLSCIPLPVITQSLLVFAPPAHIESQAPAVLPIFKHSQQCNSLIDCPLFVLECMLHEGRNFGLFCSLL